MERRTRKDLTTTEEKNLQTFGTLNFVSAGAQRREMREECDNLIEALRDLQETNRKMAEVIAEVRRTVLA